MNGFRMFSIIYAIPGQKSPGHSVWLKADLLNPQAYYASQNLKAHRGD